MIGKLIVHRPTRDDAIACMKRALDELLVEGIKTTAPFHKRVLSHATFADGLVDTKFVERELLAET
jgi:acetyl-CoA carboxylase biotin carboxylase subunit